MQKNKFAISVMFCFAAVLRSSAQTGLPAEWKNTAFTLKGNRHGLGTIQKSGDVHPTNYVRNGRVFGDVTVRYVHERKLDSLKAASAATTPFFQEGKQVG